MSLKHKLNNYTKLSEQRRRKVLKWIANQNEEVVLLAFEAQKEYVFKLSGANKSNKFVLYQSAMYLAAERLYSAYYAKNSKSRNVDLNDVQSATSLQAKRLKKSIQAEKYDKLLNLKNKILVLKDKENLSFREISKFLLKYHKLDVSHSYIATFHKKIKKENKND